MKQVLLDLDGVLVNFVAGSATLHGYHTADVYNAYTERHLGEWDIVKVLNSIKPIDPTRFWAPMGEEFWAGLGWMPDGRAILEYVERRFGRENVCIWSSPTNNLGCIPGKLRWIREHLPQHYHRHCIFGSKKEVAAHARALLIDDSDDNVKKFFRRGGSVALVPRLWNSGYDRRNNAIDFLEYQLP